MFVSSSHGGGGSRGNEEASVQRILSGLCSSSHFRARYSFHIIIIIYPFDVLLEPLYRSRLLTVGQLKGKRPRPFLSNWLIYFGFYFLCVSLSDPQMSLVTRRTSLTNGSKAWQFLYPSQSSSWLLPLMITPRSDNSADYRAESRASTNSPFCAEARAAKSLSARQSSATSAK